MRVCERKREREMLESEVVVQLQKPGMGVFVRVVFWFVLIVLVKLE